MTEEVPEEIKDLANRIMATMERDIGVHVASWYGQNPHIMTDEQLRGWAQLASCMKQTHCSECGQSLPEEES